MIIISAKVGIGANDIAPLKGARYKEEYKIGENKLFFLAISDNDDDNIVCVWACE